MPVFPRPNMPRCQSKKNIGASPAAQRPCPQAVLHPVTLGRCCSRKLDSCSTHPKTPLRQVEEKHSQGQGQGVHPCGRSEAIKSVARHRQECLSYRLSRNHSPSSPPSESL